MGVITCACVSRRISRICIKRLHHDGQEIGRSALQILHGGYSFGYPYAEYSADVLLTVRRVLRGNERRVFQRHAIDGADWRVVCREVGIDRGAMFHHLYRAEAKFGRECARLALFPFEDYLSAHYLATDQVARPTSAVAHS